MRLRSTLVVAFIALAVLQVAVVVPVALRNLSQLLQRQQDARIAQLMVAVEAESERLRHDVQRTMDELAQSAALEDAARDAVRTPAPPHVTTAAASLMVPRGLDVLALLDDQGRTLSSGHLPARLGELDDSLFGVTRWPETRIAGLRVDLSGPLGLTQAPALLTARPIDYGDRRLWAVGGVLLNHERAESLARLTGGRVEVWSGEELYAEAGQAPGTPTIRELPIGDATVVRLSFARSDLLATRNEVLRAFLVLAGFGLFLSIAAGVAVSRRVTRPVEALTTAARRIAAGEPGARVEDSRATGELKGLVDAFNRMTSDLKAATDKLVASERIAAWQEVARRLAHEIKNPLTPIRMSLETLLAASSRGTREPAFHSLLEESARAVLEEVDRLKRIVDEFSQFARLPRPRLVPFNFSEAVRQVMALYGPRHTLTYSADLAPDVWVSGDRDQLTQVLVNLIKNAEEAMSERGGRVSVVLRSDASRAVLEVDDQGPGISAELKTRLFEPYVTTKPQGTGLGLSIALRICEEHGGTLEALDSPSGGARLRAALPLCPTPPTSHHARD